MGRDAESPREPSATNRTANYVQRNDSVQTSPHGEIAQPSSGIMFGFKRESKETLCSRTV